MALLTLKKRSEFLRVRGGRRWSTPAFLLEGKPRAGGQRADKPSISSAQAPPSTASVTAQTGPSAAAGGPRFGFTVTKKLGGAVARNRIRRRLRAVIAQLAPELADPTYDYVVLARRPALDRPFVALCEDVRTAFARVHGAKPRRQGAGKRRDSGKPARAAGKTRQGSQP